MDLIIFFFPQLICILQLNHELFMSDSPTMSEFMKGVMLLKQDLTEVPAEEALKGKVAKY